MDYICASEVISSLFMREKNREGRSEREVGWEEPERERRRGEGARERKGGGRGGEGQFVLMFVPLD